MNIFTRLQNVVKNRTVLNQTEGVFAGFKRDKFGQEAIEIYNEVKRGHEVKNKITLMQYVSFPIYETLMNQHKDPKLVLPFRWYKPKSSKLIQARIFSHDTHGFNKTFTWHQVAVEFQMEDKKGQISHRMNVFERREIDGSDGSWRLSYIG